MNHKILVVQCYPNVREAVSNCLREEGYNVLAVGSAEDALEVFCKESFDLVITCIKLPGMDGITLLKELKKISHMTPVIILTAYALLETAKQAVRYGAFDFLQKPFVAEELKSSVRKALSKNNGDKKEKTK